MKSTGSKYRPIGFWPSHHRFAELVNFCTRGKSNPVLKTGSFGDHLADIVLIYLHDTDLFLWKKGARKEGATVRRILEKLNVQVSDKNDLSAAAMLYAIATAATHEVLNLYSRHRKMFDQIAPHRAFLPVLFSVHPDTAKFSAKMYRDSKLGTRTEYSRQIGSKAYFVNDSSANIYARAIIESINFNRRLDPISRQQRQWVKFDRENNVQTKILPFPKFVQGLDAFPNLITPENVLIFWRKGKEIILEEMPDFHLRPEWEKYRRARKYQTGAKTGSVQHAIFKDILASLQSIAGYNRKRSGENHKKIFPKMEI